MDLVEDIYKVSANLPKTERFGLVSQIQRSAVSIPSNIAEGSKRSSRVDFRQFCIIAIGSAAELETQLQIIKRVYPAIPVYGPLKDVVGVQKMLGSLIRKLNKIPTN